MDRYDIGAAIADDDDDEDDDEDAAGALGSWSVGSTAADAVDEKTICLDRAIVQFVFIAVHGYSVSMSWSRPILGACLIVSVMRCAQFCSGSR